MEKTRHRSGDQAVSHANWCPLPYYRGSLCSANTRRRPGGGLVDLSAEQGKASISLRPFSALLRLPRPRSATAAAKAQRTPGPKAVVKEARLRGSQSSVERRRRRLLVEFGATPPSPRRRGIESPLKSCAYCLARTSVNCATFIWPYNSCSIAVACSSVALDIVVPHLRNRSTSASIAAPAYRRGT